MDPGLLRKKRGTLSSLKNQLDQQDQILKDLQRRSQPWEGAPESLMQVLSTLFGEIAEVLPIGVSLQFRDGRLLCLRGLLTKERFQGHDDEICALFIDVSNFEAWHAKETPYVYQYPAYPMTKGVRVAGNLTELSL